MSSVVPQRAQRPRRRSSEVAEPHTPARHRAVIDARAGRHAPGCAEQPSRTSPAGAMERQLYLTVGWTGLSPEAFDSLIRAAGVPPVPPPEQDWLSHLWLAPVLGHTVFLWSHADGWSRHEPYG
jgi:hypothetical protein